MKKHQSRKDVERQQPEMGCVSKSVRQAAFIASCKDLTVDEAVQKAKLFQDFNRDDFKIIRMVG